MSCDNFKSFLSRIILVALIGAAVGFLYSLSLPKYWQVTGKIVIVPSGSSPTAGANLFAEAGNAAEMIASPSFQKAHFSDFSGNFSGAHQIGNSSTMAVSFLSPQSDITSTEDLLVKMPQNIAEYAKEIYGGSPFKYLLISDPDVSENPVQPDIYKYILRGFAAGLVLYFLYWLFFENYKFSEKQEFPPAGKITSPDMKEEKKESVQGEIRFVKPMTEEKPKPAAKKIIQPISSAPVASTLGVPENLPISEEAVPPASEYQEPSDEEVKERLNRLMRGEL